MNEADLSRYIYDKATKMGCLVVKIDASHRGWPDRLILKNGKCMFIEVKHPNGKGRLSKIQEYMISKIKSKGVSVYVVDNKKYADDLIKEFTEDKK